MKRGRRATFGQQLRSYRKAAGLTQGVLAARLKVGQRTVRDWESDRHQPRASMVELLIRVLEVPVEEQAQFRGATQTPRDEASVENMPVLVPSTPIHALTAPSRAAPPPNFPSERTSFVGREREMGELARLLEHSRLLTLTGPGGVGKTRLAVQVASETRARFSDGVRFIALASISDPALVPAAIAATLGVKGEGEQLLDESLQAYLRPRHQLLVLDNFEHVIEVAPLLSTLLDIAPRLVLLVTSRERLNLYGEQEYPVQPLALPGGKHAASAGHAGRYSAVELFQQRAQAVRPDFRLTDENAHAVAEICTRLDGLPLAIELAAAWIKLFVPAELLQRLAHPLETVTGGPRDRQPRQQGLRSTMDWSYSLLTREEQRLFARLGVFAGGFTLEAAQAVCTVDNDLALHVVDGVFSLVNKSLLRHDNSDGSSRFTLLQTIRDYALARLKEGEPIDVVREQHARWYLALTEAAAPKLGGSDQVRWLRYLDIEYDNLRAALQWALDQGEGTIALRFAGALAPFWQVRSPISEGRRWLEAILAIDQDPGIQRRAPEILLAHVKALTTAGNLAQGQSDFVRARELHTESLALAEELGDKRASATVLNNLAGLAVAQGDYAGGALLLERALTLAQEIEDNRATKRAIAETLTNWAWLTRDQGNYEQASALLERALALARELEDKRAINEALLSLAWLALYHSNYGRATALLDEVLALARELGNKLHAVRALDHLALIALEQGDYARATELLAGCLELAQEVADYLHVAWVVNKIGLVALEQGDYAHARPQFDESLKLFKELEDRTGIAVSLWDLGWVALAEGDYEQAAALYRESLDLLLFRPRGDERNIAYCLEGLSGLATAQRKPERAARLWAAAEALRSAFSIPLPPADQSRYTPFLTAARLQLDETGWKNAWVEGQAMTMEQAIAYALDDSTNG